MLLFSQNRENAAYLWEFIMAYKEGFGTIYYVPQFSPEDLPRQSASPKVLRFLGENLSFMVANLWSDWGIRTSNLIILKIFYLLPWVPWCGHSWQDVSKDHPSLELDFSRLRSTWGSSICECELGTLWNERRGVRNTFSETRFRHSSDLNSAY